MGIHCLLYIPGDNQEVPLCSLEDIHMKLVLHSPYKYCLVHMEKVGTV